MARVDHMVTFAHVVQAGSFTAAGDRLRLAPSVVSKHVAKLEKDLGVRLLNRSTRSLSPTEAGQAYYAHCARIVEELTASEQAVARLQAEPQGHLRISCMNSVITALLAPMLPDFMRRYPKIELEIIANERMVDLAEQGFDLALRVTDGPAANLVARSLMPVRFQLCASPAYLEKYGRPQSLAELRHHRCLGYPASLAENWVFSHKGQRVVCPVACSVQVNSVDVLRKLALADSGLALLPLFSVAQELKDGRLECLLPDYHGFAEASLYAVYLPSRFGLPKRKAFIDSLNDYIHELPQWECA